MRTKNFSIMRLILCAGIIFSIIVPYEYALLSFNGFIQSGDLAEKAWIITVASLSFVLLCVVAAHRLLKTHNALFGCCVILFVTDPLLECSMLNLKYVCLLIATVLLCFYFMQGKSPVLKTVLMAVFAFACVMIYTDSAFCHVPIAALVYGFAQMSAGKKTDNSNDEDKKLVTLPKAVIIPSLAVPYLLAVIVKTVFADTLFDHDVIFRFVSIDNLFYNGRLFVAVVPGVCLLMMFVHKYFATKYEGEKTTVSIVWKKAELLLPILIPLVPILLGIFVFDSYPAAIVANMFIIIAMIALYQHDQQTASGSVGKLLVMFKKHKFMWCLLFFAWLVVVNYLFKDSSTSILDYISDFAGGRL